MRDECEALSLGISLIIYALLGHILGNGAKRLKTSCPNMWTRYMHDECEALSLNTLSHQENTEQLRAPMFSRESFWSPKVGVFRSMIFLFLFTNSLIYIVINYLFWETQWSLNPLFVLFDCVDGKSLPTPAEGWMLLARTEKETYNTLAEADNDSASQTSNITQQNENITWHPLQSTRVSTSIVPL
jgi:hypothetical protein